MNNNCGYIKKVYIIENQFINAYTNLDLCKNKDYQKETDQFSRIFW